MKKYLMLLAIGMVGLLSFDASALKREHRATWMSAYVNDWPSTPITAGNAETLKKVGLTALDSLQRNNFTTIYYHARVMCDAMYDSKYEPWSSFVSPTRGETPAFDPLAFIVENAHARGLEVYAWLNPYRYLNSESQEGWGSAGGDKNYENSHPEWLIKWKNGSQTWTILNPALPEVKQRIVDVVADILDKYDVDGIVFDDYFYQNGLPTTYDADDYNAYLAEGGTLSQGDWRRENVNDMVRKVNAYIKSTKPWVRFGIGPAGVAASDADVAAKYGVEPCPGSDWQYDGIYSDPLAWLSEGTIDFISPQVYWKIGNAAADYAKITPWWYEVSHKFNRHCFISQDLSNTAGSTSPLSEFYDQISLTHTSAGDAAPGTVYFPWRSLLNKSQRIDGKKVTLFTYLRGSLFDTHSLTPAVEWVEAPYPGQVSNVARSGRVLSWTGLENVRYTVYAVPSDIAPENFYKDAEYLLGVSYEPSFEIPAADADYPGYGIADADLGNYNYAVAVLDRYGNEYGAVFVGADVETAATPALTYPVGGALAPNRFTFSWEGTAPIYEIQIATDPEMKELVVRRELTGNVVKSEELFDFEADKDYYWTVTARGNNAIEACSNVESFRVDKFRLTSPAAEATDVSLTPTLTWSKFADDAVYKLSLSTRVGFSVMAYETSTRETSCAIPLYYLDGNTLYYAKVEARTPDGTVDETETIEFTTEYVDVPVPTILAPATDGETMYSNKCISLQPQEGVGQTRIMVSASKSFPARSSYTGTFETRFYTPNLSEIEMISTPLADGETYYVRARFSYRNESGAVVNTDWTLARSFVYSAASGVDNMESDGVRLIGGDEPMLVAGEAGLAVAVYSLDGREVYGTTTDASGNASLSMLADGVYVVTVRLSDDSMRTFKLIR